MGSPDSHVQVNCPYCTQAWKGPDVHNWIKLHVSTFHPEKLEEFQKLGRDSYTTMVLTHTGEAKLKREEKLRKKKEEEMLMEEKKSQETQKAVQPAENTAEPQKETIATPQKETVATPQQTVQAPIKVPAKMEMPFEKVLDEEEWLMEFLQRYDLSTKFLTFQIEKLRVKGVLPHPRELLSDLNELDSGSKIKKQNDLIAWFYDHALGQYMKKRESLNMPFVSLPWGYQPDASPQPPGYGSDRTQFGIQQTTTEQSRQTSNYEAYSEVRELKAKLEAMQQEKYNEMANKLRDLEMKYEQAKTMPHQDSDTQRLATKLEMMEAKLQDAQQKIADQNTQMLMGKFADLEKRATNAPTQDTIQSIVQQMLESRETVRLRPEELDQKIKEMILKEKTGITPEAVEMSKIEKQYELDKLKLEKEGAAPAQWLDGLKDIAQTAASVIGDRMGQAMAGKPQMPPQQNPNLPPTGPLEQEQQTAPQMRPCPSCGKAVMVSSPGQIGQCPHCRNPMQVTETGDLVAFDIKGMTPQRTQPQVEQPAEETKQPTNGTSLGNCTGCGRTLYYFNIAETEADGKQWCKACRGAQKNGLP